MRTIEDLTRKNIRDLAPYKCARDEFQGEARIYLDANESPFNAPYDRYPDPLQKDLKKKISALKKVRESQIMLGVGSDEPIDLIERIFCEPRIDNIVSIAPSYGMYSVEASVNDIEFREVFLDENFAMNADKMLAATNSHTTVMFICSPNNPTGNIIEKTEILRLLNEWDGIVVIDEAYIDFAPEGSSWLTVLDQYEKLIVLQTFSKAWAMAGIRCGMAFANEPIIQLMNKVKYPYNMNQLTQEYVSRQLDKKEEKEEWVKLTISERERVKTELMKQSNVSFVYPSDANFLLVKMDDAKGTYLRLIDEGIIVRNRSNVRLCEGCLRITIGTKKENDELLKAL